MRKAKHVRRLGVAAFLFSIFACPSFAQCDASLWRHVYHAQRLKVVQECASVTGTIVDASHGRTKDGARHEADGDSHNWLQLDAGQESLLLPGNTETQQGNLVFELICRYRVTQTDAKDACKNFKNPVKLPPVGTHVRITGALIDDLAHKPIHRELHPVTSIEVLRTLGPPQVQCSPTDWNDCEIVQMYDPPELTPLGCFLAKTRLLWIFGARTWMCPTKVKS
jgi:hypothetical protein